MQLKQASLPREVLVEIGKLWIEYKLPDLLLDAALLTTLPPGMGQLFFFSVCDFQSIQDQSKVKGTSEII